MSTTVLVLYYSRHGSTRALAEKIALGAEKAGAQTLLRTVAEIGEQGHGGGVHTGAPLVTLEDLRQCHGLALGSPTRFGNMAAPMKWFLDQTTQTWLSGDLIGKPACVFTSTSSLHGGQESTLLSMMLPLLHHGMLLMGTPYAEPSLHLTRTGGTPYGPSHWEGNTETGLSQDESTLAFAQGQRLAKVAQQLYTRENYV